MVTGGDRYISGLNVEAHAALGEADVPGILVLDLPVGRRHFSLAWWICSEKGGRREDFEFVSGSEKFIHKKLVNVPSCIY